MSFGVDVKVFGPSIFGFWIFFLPFPVVVMSVAAFCVRGRLVMFVSYGDITGRL